MKLDNTFSKTLKGGFLLAALALVLGCNDEVSHPHEHNENELFTTVKLELVNAADATDKTSAQLVDKDGEGGAAAVITGALKLKAGATYKGSLTLLDESNPASVVNMGEEVLEEGHDHLVVYTKTSDVKVSISLTDKDKNGKGIGLSTEFKAETKSSGKLTVELRHQPGQKDGTAAPGSTDVSATFDISVE